MTDETESRSHDVAVCGATAGGALAAVAAAREGVRVVLLEAGRHVVGMVSGGLGWTDTGDRSLIGGLILGFYEKVARRYGVETWGQVGGAGDAVDLDLELGEPGRDHEGADAESVGAARLAGMKKSIA